jgi:phosphatidate cytidylyltransferase
MINFIQRLVTSLLVGSIVIYSILISSPLFTFLIGFVCAIMLVEFFSITKKPARITKNSKFLSKNKQIVFSLLYIVAPCIILLLLFQKDEFLVLLLLVLTWATDIGAYVFGRTLGRVKIFSLKIAPKISPKKTYIGLMGAILFTFFTLELLINYYSDFICVYVQQVCMENKVELFRYKLAFVLAFVFVAQAGDFFESYLKRKFNKKDSGNILPGHGGMLDRCDGVIFIALIFGSIAMFL